MSQLGIDSDNSLVVCFFLTVAAVSKARPDFLDILGLKP